MSDKGVKVSAIIPTYKRSSDVGKAIRSVCQQTLEDIEVIVVDDNSPESDERRKTKELVNNIIKEDSRVIYIEHPKNMNGSVARNSGIKIASGEYISFLDDDDEYLPEKLQKQYDAMKNLPENYGGCVVDCLILRNGQIVKTLSVDGQNNALKEVLSCTYNMGSGSNLFVKSEIVKEIGGFDESLLRHQDYDFLVRFFMKYDMFKLSEPLFSIEQRSDHLNTPNLEKAEIAKRIYLNKYKEVIDSFPEDEKDNIYSKNYMSLAETAARGRKFTKVKKYYLVANKHYTIESKQTLRLVLLGGYSLVPVAIKKHLKFGK